MEDECSDQLVIDAGGYSDSDLLRGTEPDAEPVDGLPFIYSEPVLNRTLPVFAKRTPPVLSSIESLPEAGSHTPSFAALLEDDSRQLPASKNYVTRPQSDIEIRHQHYQRQKRYAAKRAERSRRLTDIDFEGILNLIGGCSRWQIFVYAIISAHQVPHAMFNLSVVYMMYQPDHWCQIPNFNHQSFSSEGRPNYTWDDVLNTEIAFPKTFNKQRAKEHHDQCHFYKRNFVHLKLLDYRQATNLSTHMVPIERCTNWEYDTSVMRKTVVTEWNRVCDDNWSRAHVHMSYSLGYLMGCFIGGWVSDRYGRKTAIWAFGVLSLIFGFLLPYATEFPIFLVMRFLLAASNEAADLAAYVICMEITGVKYRSIVGSLLQAPWACGYAFLAFVAYMTKSWTSIHAITVALHMIAMVPMYWLPESPRWLILMDQVKPAESIIRRACQMNKSRLPSDLGLIRHAEKKKWRRKDKRPSYIDLFRSSALRFRNCVLFVIWIATALVYYGLVIALSDQSSPGRSVFDGNFFLNNAIAGAIELPTLALCVVLLKMGRKKSQMVTLIGAGISILCAVYMSAEKHTTYALVFMLLGKACIQGAFNILYIFTSELNPTVVRNTAVGIFSMVARMGSGASGYIAILSDVTLPLVPMLIFALFSLVAGVLVLCLPETQGLPLPETIWDALNMKKCRAQHLTEAFLGVDESVDDIPDEVAAERKRSSKRTATVREEDEDVGSDSDSESEPEPEPGIKPRPDVGKPKNQTKTEETTQKT